VLPPPLAQIGKGELDGCTFKPKITPLPAQYGSTPLSFHQRAALSAAAGVPPSQAPFEDRVLAWDRAKRDEMRRAAEERERRELEQCTFTPTISATSREVATRTRGGSQGPGGRGGEEIHERLFKQALAAQQASGAGAARPYSAAAGAASYAFAADGGPAVLLSGGSGAAGGAEAPNSPGAESAPRGRSSSAQASARRFSEGRPLFTSTLTGSQQAPLDRARLEGATAQLTREEQEYLAECTFEPRINPVVDARPVRSRYRDPTPTRSGEGAAAAAAAAAAAGGGFEGGASRAAAHPPPLPSGLEKCTFQPQTNALRAASMPVAAAYVQTPIFQRLANTKTAAQVEREQQVREDAARHAAAQQAAAADAELGGTSGAGARAASAAASAASGASGAGAAADGAGAPASASAAAPPAPPAVSAAQSAERERRLQEFLSRQVAAARKKVEGVEAARRAAAPSLQPALCERSLRIVQSKGSGPFLDRIVHDAIRAEHDNLRTQARHSHDPECTFAPAINPSSRAMRPRSVVDMSRGDALKRETAARLLRLRIEQEDLEGITFRPRINERSRVSEGRLRILSDPDNYVRRIQHEQDLQAEKARRALSEKEAAERAACTFAPAVHGAPAYVSQIAASMALARSAKELGAPARPDWR
jgi:hypothetical protein